MNKHNERQDTAVHHINLLEELLELNRIYFADALCLKIENIISESKDVANEMYKVKLLVEHTQETHSMALHNGEDYIDKWNKADSTVSKVRAARFELVNEFREMTGVH